MTGRLAGLSALVTGGGSGIGRGVVEAYLAEGARVTVLERSQDNADALAGQYPGEVSVLVGDATEESVVTEAVAVASEQGGLDQLTCCVGIFDYYASVRTLTANDVASAAGEVWRTNVLSTLLAVTVAYPRLRERRGSVTLTLSESAFQPVGGGVLYGSSKWALRGVVAHLAKDLGPEVRVNGVAPGGTAGTRFGGLATLGQRQTADTVAGRDERIRAGNALGVVPTPADHAPAYVYLADPEQARVVTGVVLNTDGGRS